MTPPLEKPVLRGVLHHYAFYASLPAAVVLLVLAPTPAAWAAALVYGLSLSGLLATSALFHRITWSVEARRWMGRLDHLMIGVLIAGTYTPFGVIAVTGPSAALLLTAMWIGALCIATVHLVWLDAPKRLSTILYIVLGWIGVAALPELIANAGWTPTLLLGVGGLVYSAGAAAYALQRPNPVPGIFGYHELFHACVVAGAALHYWAVLLVLPNAR